MHNIPYRETDNRKEIRLQKKCFCYLNLERENPDQRYNLNGKNVVMILFNRVGMLLIPKYEQRFKRQNLIVEIPIIV